MNSGDFWMNGKSSVIKTRVFDVDHMASSYRNLTNFTTE